MRFPHMLPAGMFATALLTTPLLQAAPPDAGQSMRELEQGPPQLPPRQRLELELPDSPSGSTADDGSRVQVSRFLIEGNTAISTAELQAELADLPQRSLSLGELREGASRLTRLYRSRGYPLARAYLPAQEIDQGVVRIAVLEGRYGQVRVDKADGIHAWALAPLHALRQGDVVRADALEHSLLLLQDTPGLSVRSTLKPGAEVGTSDLVVQVEPTPLLSGSVDLDNYGNRYTGAYRLGATVNLSNPLGIGDQLTLRALGTDEAQRYYRAAYQLPVSPWGTRLSLAYSSMDYQLARDFDDLDAHGTARIASAQLLQPLVRSRDFWLSAGLEFADKRLRDKIDAFAYRKDKRARVLSAALAASAQDQWLGGGSTSATLEYSVGDLHIKDEAERQLDRSTARTEGSFAKLVANLQRLQRLTDRFSLYARLQSQWADGNLDSSEKLNLGGAYGVRAYPQGEAVADEGWLTSIELRYALTPAWQLSTFLDHGQARLNKRSWDEDDNYRQLSAAGLGASWSKQGWDINAVAAWKLGAEEAESDSDRSPRVWLQLVRRF
ncbi:ShlB/FhaC/HecB family hemolysin secretion/activation protein [Azoarcus sp. TTM-91]|uniref:ShlB/FhaC/HecB family hemolysin secretion/activation protein n=1 Tax=Azoarcus sp. TTM-91 TaxID=2691581 RepID=UPI001B7CDB30|nr:ShlB/FhaC/HecB family hemolysin secretion/activation protein [Azoarcus sp. TTM-91]